ncbi:kelch-like protein 14 [Amphiura filiformis]|uniref:kelch-like protein 14 n=1 Tax=Amphiura filiformis TaxID=82378 RepID=UPI003B20EDBB
MEVTMATVFGIMDMAHYLQFDYAMDSCVCFLENELDHSSQGLNSLNTEVALKVLTRADLFGLDTLKKECKDYLAKNFKVSDEFVAHMTAGLMEEMLERVDLTDEKEVFDATVAWLNHSWESRKTYAPSFLSKIRLGIVPLGHLSMTVFKSPDLYAIPECKELIEKALKMFDSKQPNDPPLHTKEPNLFATRTTVNAVLCIGKGRKVPSYYDVDKSCWISLPKFPALPLKDCLGAVGSCCNADGNLFVARGMTRLPIKLRYPQFIKFDYANSRWQTLAPMQQRRKKPLLVHMKGPENGEIYVIGDHGDESYVHSTCEVYSISTNKWQPIPSMPTNISTAVFKANPASCVACNGVILIYAPVYHGTVGTVNSYHLVMYNPATRSWSILTTVFHPAPWRICGLVVHDDKCYRVVGGNCKCKDPLCGWHEINVHELVIDVRNGNALIGEMQDQSAITAEPEFSKYKNSAFLINSELFAIAKKRFHKIGVSNQDDSNQLYELHKYFLMKSGPDNTYHSSLITSFMFDKSMWL